MQSLLFLGVVVLGLMVIIIGYAAMISRFYHKVEGGRALVINKATHTPVVSFSGGLVLPIVHRAEIVDLTTKTIEMERTVVCSDGAEVRVRLKWFLKVTPTAEDVVKVVQTIGAAATHDVEALRRLFDDKLWSGFRRVASQQTYEELRSRLQKVEDAALREVGRDLGGYVIEAVAVASVSPTASAPPADLSALAQAVDDLEKRVAALEAGSS